MTEQKKPEVGFVKVDPKNPQAAGAALTAFLMKSIQGSKDREAKAGQCGSGSSRRWGRTF